MIVAQPSAQAYRHRDRGQGGRSSIGSAPGGFGLRLAPDVDIDVAGNSFLTHESKRIRASGFFLSVGVARICQFMVVLELYVSKYNGASLGSILL